MAQERTFSRQELYEQVWKTPMSKLASEFGVSDRGLAKICERHHIPVPPRGYWAKKAHGKRVKAAPLKARHDSTSDAITITATESDETSRTSTEAECPELVAARLYEAQPENLIGVSERIRRRHPLVTRTEDALKSAYLNTRGTFDARYGCLDVSVSKTQVPRAMRVMQALLTAFDQRGYSLELPPDKLDHYNATAFRQPRIKILGQSLEFGIMERVKQTRNLAKRPGNVAASDYVYTPTGELSLRCKTLYDGGRHRWADTATLKVENRLNEFVLALVEIAVRERALHAYWAEQRRLEAAAEQRRYEEAKRIKALDSEAVAWGKAQQLRAYIAAVEQHAKREGPIEKDSELDRWLQWARAYADQMDPLLSVVGNEDEDEDDNFLDQDEDAP